MGVVRRILRARVFPAFVLMVIAALAVTGSWLGWEREQREIQDDERIDQTAQRLRFWQEALADYPTLGIRPPSTEGRDASPKLVTDEVETRWETHMKKNGGGWDWQGYPSSYFSVRGGLELHDAWGQPFIYRCPGTVHPHGWDIYSPGPDGVDDHGSGDDLLVGADFTPITSGQ